MKLCYAVLYYPERLRGVRPREYLEAVRLTHALPRSLAARGHEVHVVHLHPSEGELTLDGVTHHFVAPGPVARALGAGLAQATGLARAVVEPAWRPIRHIRALCPDVVHFAGTTLHLNLALLCLRLGSGAPPIVVQHHGGRPAAGAWGRRLQQFGFARAARVLFTTAEDAQPFCEAGVIDAGEDRLREVMETSSTLSATPKSEARQQTGMTGRPAYLWTARLHPIKDPLTALRGFARIAGAQREARLYLHYLSAELLPEMRAFVSAHPDLDGRVHFGGPVPYERMAAIYSSADFLLQASHREFSGCAVLDAMACGAIPVVTDIPSFRVMTDGGRTGVLFPRGDAESLARQVLAIPYDAIAPKAAAVRARFETLFSFPALALRLEQEYQAVSER